MLSTCLIGRAPRSVLAAALCAGLFLGAPDARADSFGDTLDAAVALSAGSLVAGIGGFVVLIGNARYLEQREVTPPGWYVSGFVFGGANLALGAGWFGLAAASHDTGAPLGLGVASVALGALDIGLSAGNVAKRPPDKVARNLVPLVLTDARGRASPGVGIRFGSF